MEHCHAWKPWSGNETRSENTWLEKWRHVNLCLKKPKGLSGRVVQGSGYMQATSSKLVRVKIWLLLSKVSTIPQVRCLRNCSLSSARSGSTSVTPPVSSSQWPVNIPSGYRLCSLDMLQSVISSGAVWKVCKKGTLYMKELAYLHAGMASHLSLKCYYCQPEQVFPTSFIINKCPCQLLHEHGYAPASVEGFLLHSCFRSVQDFRRSVWWNSAACG